MDKFIKHLLFLLFITTVSCSSDMNSIEDKHDNEIYGVWIDSIAIQPKGLRVEKLTIRSNSSFKYIIEGFGVYENQILDDKSFSHEDFGNFVLSTRNIYFVSNQHQYWDLEYQITPKTMIEDNVLFESCTYTIVIDTLTLKFKSSGANLDTNATIKLTRLE